MTHDEAEKLNPGDTVIVESRLNQGRYVGRKAIFIQTYPTKSDDPDGKRKIQVRLTQWTPGLESPDGYLYLSASEIRAAPKSADADALDRINHILSDPDWGVGMLEDICDIVRGTGRRAVADAEWLRH